MKRQLDQRLFSPDGVNPVTGKAESSGTGIMDLESALGGDDDATKDEEEVVADKVEEPEEDEEEEEEEPEESDDKESDEEEENKDEDLEEILHPFSRKQFLKDFPDAFKKYPQLEKAYYGNQKYREIFPTLDDAREASENLERFSAIEADLAKGSSEGLLSALKETDERSFQQVVDNYLPNLQKIDSEAYYHVIGNTIKHTIISMANAAQEAKDDDLLTAAKILNKFTFGVDKFDPPAKFTKEVEDDKTKEVNAEREQFNKERLETHQADLTGRVENTIVKTIEKYIDPRSSMTNYVRRNAIREANEMVANLISKDREFTRIKDKLWEKAAEAKFSQDSLSNIRRAYIGRAQQYLPQVIKKIRSEALRGVGGTPREEKDRKGNLPIGSSSTSRSNKSGTKLSLKDIPKGARTIDLLNSD
jgi:hypothetical protein